MDLEQKEKISKALRTVENLYPSLPVLSKLTSLLNDMNIDQSDIAKLIKTDASLTSDIIRISNSPVYASASKCVDVNNALFIIGQHRVLNVVSLCIARKLFNQDLTHYGVSADDYWSNSIVVGVLMELLSMPLGMDRDQAYTAGILHSVGMTIINRILVDLDIEVFWDSSIPQIVWEEQLTGYNYAAAGAEVLERWKFPTEFTNLIRFQVTPEKAPEQSTILDCLCFVINLVNLTGWKLQLYESVELDDACRQFLVKHHVDEEHLGHILVQAHKQMGTIMSMFQS